MSLPSAWRRYNPLMLNKLAFLVMFAACFGTGAGLVWLLVR
jgi:hypothetical protein